MSRIITAYSKETHKIQNVVYGRIFNCGEGKQRVLFIQTNRDDQEVLEMAKAKCEELGLELWKVSVTKTKPTSFNTNASWEDRVIYLDESNAEYYEGVFDREGNKIDE